LLADCMHVKCMFANCISCLFQTSVVGAFSTTSTQAPVQSKVRLTHGEPAECIYYDLDGAHVSVN